MGLWDDKIGFNYEKFERERMGFGRGKMQWKDWSDVAYYYGLGTTINCNEVELRKGNMTSTLYESLCRTFGREAMEEYFKPDEPKQQKPLSKEEREIEELADLMVFGRKQKN